MQPLTKNVWLETGLRGSNHGLVTTSDGLVLIDGPHKPSDTLRLKAEIERRGVPLRYILNTEPHGDHWTSNAYFDVPVIAHEGVRRRILEANMADMLARVATFGPEEPPLLDGYRPNAPVITFDSEMTLHVGDHTSSSIEEWVAYVRGAVGRGMTKEQCLASLTAMTDRYPMDVGQDGMAPRVMQLNIGNLYDYVTGTGLHHGGAWGA